MCYNQNVVNYSVKDMAVKGGDEIEDGAKDGSNLRYQTDYNSRIMQERYQDSYLLNLKIQMQICSINV